MQRSLRLTLLGILTALAACASPFLPVKYRSHTQIYDPFRACTIGPHQSELLGPLEDVRETDALRIVRRRVPPGIAAPKADISLGPNTFPAVSTATERWLFGVKDHTDRWLLPCLYDQVVCRGGSATAFHHVGGNVFVSAADVSASQRHIDVQFVPTYDYDDPWSSHQIVVLRLADGAPPSIERRMLVQRDRIQIGERRWQGFRGVPAGQANTNDSDWPAYLASHHERVVGAEDAFHCLNRHVWPNRHGVWFCAPRGNGGVWRMWFWDADTNEVAEHEDVRGILRRSAADHRTLPLLARIAPGDPTLLWPWREETRTFAPPTGSAGVVPLTYQVVRQAPIYNLLRPTPVHGEPWKTILVTFGYWTTIDEFLAAYDTADGRCWGTLNRELQEPSGPVYAKVELRRSTQLESRLHYRAKEHGVSYWVIAERRADGARSIGHGRVAARPESFLKAPPDQLIQEAEAMVAEVNREEFRKFKVLQEAQACADRAFEQQELLRKEQQAAAAAEEARQAKLAAERAAAPRNTGNSGAGSSSSGESYDQWRKSTWASIEANQRGLTGSAFSSYMDRYGR